MFLFRYLLPALVLLSAGVQSAPPPGKTDLAVLVHGNHRSAADLYQQLKRNSGNLLFSPYSISSSMGMAWMGAKGTTQEQMAKVLSIHLPKPRFASAYHHLFQKLNRQESQTACALQTALGLWIERSQKILPAFEQTARKQFKATVAQLNFSEQPEEARATINEWVKKQTQNHIDQLLPNGFLQPDTKIVVVNAIYFKGRWEKPFRKDLTQRLPFQLSKEKQITTDLMRTEGRFPYLDRKSFQVLELPYQGQQLSMVIFLPKQRNGIDNMEKMLTPELIRKSIRRLAPTVVRAQIPKFEMASELRLNRALRAMGMANAFSREANFSGITGQRNLAISQVVHKAMITVDEEGTEAAAASGVGVRPISEQFPPAPVFRADHPFLFLIREKSTGSILFMGRVSNPKQ